MWISQTYLGEISSDADVYIYYFFEDYARQIKVPRRVASLMAELGYSFKEKISVFSPMDGYVGNIRQEMVERFREFWQKFSNQTPGIFLCHVPLRDFDPEKDEWLFLPISNSVMKDDKVAQDFFRDLHKICTDALSEREKLRSKKPERKALYFNQYMIPLSSS